MINQESIVKAAEYQFKKFRNAVNVCLYSDWYLPLKI